MSVTVSVPVAVPSASGVNDTEMAQLARGANVAPQLLVWENTPLTAMFLMASAPVPVFCSATVCGALVDPVVRVANDRLAGLSVAV